MSKLDTTHETVCANCSPRSGLGVFRRGDSVYCPLCGKVATNLRPLSGPLVRFFKPCEGCEACRPNGEAALGVLAE